MASRPTIAPVSAPEREHVSTARLILELKLQGEEENGEEWEPATVAAYHWLCGLEGIRGYDEIPLSLLEEIAQMNREQGLSVCTWIRMRIQRGSCPPLRDTSRDTPHPPGELKPAADRVSSGESLPDDATTAPIVNPQGGQA